MAIKSKIFNNRKTVYELALNIYGNISYVFYILNYNTNILTGVNDSIAAGQAVIYDDSISFSNSTKTDSKNTNPTAIAKTIRIMNNQTIFDMAIQLSGSLENVFDLLNNNQSIKSIDNLDLTGIELTYFESNNLVPTFFKTNSIAIATGIKTSSLVGGRQFDDSFDLSFL